MTKNYFTGVEVDEQTYAEVQRITDLLVQYKIMEPPAVKGSTETTFTDEFWEFRRDFFKEQVINPIFRSTSEKKNKLAVGELATLQVGMFIYLQQLQHRWQFDFKEYKKWVRNLSYDKQQEIVDMANIIGGFDRAYLDAIYATETKLYDKMIELGILLSNGKLTSEFRSYVEIFFHDVYQKPISAMEIDKTSGQSSDILVCLTGFLDISTQEFNDISESSHREAERNDLLHMTQIIKQCLLAELDEKNRISN